MTAKRKARLDTVLAELRAGPWTPAGGWEDEGVLRNCEVMVGAAAGLAAKSQALACVVVNLLAERQPDTVRGVMYAAVSAGWLPDTTRPSYDRVQRLLNALRRKRIIQFDWIVDNIRATDKPSSWSGLADFADTVRDAYRLDYWKNLPQYVALIVEKDTAAGRIAPVTREYDVALHPLRGFSSTTFAYGIGEQWRRIEKPIHCYYIGDHDPSGRGIEDSIRERLTEFSGGRSFAWKRLAVEPEHFDQYRIIPLAPKKKDTRYERFARRYGERCAEVEAVPADALRDMVRDAIESHIPQGQWERLQDVEDHERRAWHDVMGNIGRLSVGNGNGNGNGGVHA